VKKTYVYDPIQKKVVEKAKRTNVSLHAVHTMEEFISPVDKSIIRTHADLRNHNKKHGVTDMRDYSPDFLDKAQKERMSLFNERGKKDRLNDLNNAYEKQRELER